MNARKAFRYWIVAGLFLFVAVTYMNCAPSGFAGNAPVVASSISDVNVLPATATVPFGSVMQFTAKGGTSPYTYRVTSGGGSIDPTTGSFSAPASADTIWVQVTDAVGAVGIANINVSSQITVIPATPTGTIGGNNGGPGTGGSSMDCTAMIYGEHVYATDGSPGGFGYATAVVSESDPTTCASFCNTENASYCEWLPTGTNGSASASCVAWAGGITLTTTTSSTMTYAGSCDCNTADPSSACYVSSGGQGPIVAEQLRRQRATPVNFTPSH